MIRHATLNDITEIVELQQAFQEEHKNGYDTEFYNRAPDAAEQFGSWLRGRMEKNSAGVFVAEEHGLQGYVTGWLEERPPLYTLRTIGYLSNIYVKPEHRNKGIARDLNSALLDWFREKGVAFVELSVDSRAQGTVDAWQKLGYHELGKRMRLKL